MNSETQLRNKGKEALGTVIGREKNIGIIEKLVWQVYGQKKQDDREDKEDKEDMDENTKLYNQYILQIVCDVANGVKLGKLVKNIKKKIIGWDHPMFTGVKNNISEHDEFLRNPFKIEEGLFECGKCGSKRTFSYIKQERSSDESSTVRVECVGCGNKWKAN